MNIDEAIEAKAYMNGYEQCVKDALKWIPVTERLPEENETVLVCGEDGVEPGVFYGKSGFWTYDLYEQDPIFGVTHWMPLPQPPKGE